jgi:hypothetical protein
VFIEDDTFPAACGQADEMVGASVHVPEAGPNIGVGADLVGNDLRYCRLGGDGSNGSGGGMELPQRDIASNEIVIEAVLTEDLQSVDARDDEFLVVIGRAGADVSAVRVVQVDGSWNTAPLAGGLWMVRLTLPEGMTSFSQEVASAEDYVTYEGIGGFTITTTDGLSSSFSSYGPIGGWLTPSTVMAVTPDNLPAPLDSSLACAFASGPGRPGLKHIVDGKAEVSELMSVALVARADWNSSHYVVTLWRDSQGVGGSLSTDSSGCLGGVGAMSQPPWPAVTGVLGGRHGDGILAPTILAGRTGQGQVSGLSVTLEDGTIVQAEVADGWWVIILPGTATGTIALDANWANGKRTRTQVYVDELITADNPQTPDPAACFAMFDETETNEGCPLK